MRNYDFYIDRSRKIIKFKRANCDSGIDYHSLYSDNYPKEDLVKKRKIHKIKQKIRKK